MAPWLEDVFYEALIRVLEWRLKQVLTGAIWGIRPRHLYRNERLGSLQGGPLFRSLKVLWWPDAKQVHLEELRRQCPKLVINPPRQRFSQALGPRRLPPEADLLTPLDCRDALQVAQYAWAELCPALDGSEGWFSIPGLQG